MADIDESYAAFLQSLQDPGPWAVAGPEDGGGGGDEEEEDEDETEDDRDGVEYIGSQTVDVADDDEDATASAQARLGEEEEPRYERLGGGGEGEACSPGRFGADGADSEVSQSKRGEIDGLFCPICMEAWTDDGDHQMCCLPCGHIYGMSCIKRWLKQRGNSGKCPQCNSKCKLKDVRKLFASCLVTVDEESQKKIRFLEAKCASLEKKVAGWHMKEVEWKRQVKEWHERMNEFEKRESEMNERLYHLKMRKTDK